MPVAPVQSLLFLHLLRDRRDEVRIFVFGIGRITFSHQQCATQSIHSHPLYPPLLYDRARTVLSLSLQRRLPNGEESVHPGNEGRSEIQEICVGCQRKTHDVKCIHTSRVLFYKRSEKAKLVCQPSPFKRLLIYRKRCILFWAALCTEKDDMVVRGEDGVRGTAVARTTR